MTFARHDKNLTLTGFFMTQGLIQAYRQAPWRIQLQRIGLFLLGVVVIALVAGFYLDITARTTEAGVFILRGEAKKEETQREIANLKTQLAMVTSSTSMEKRASDLGYERPDINHVHYMLIAGYTGRKTAEFAPPPSPALIKHSLIKPVYTQSLWEWVVQETVKINEQPLGGK
jgi:hypothetical protein